MPPKTAPKIALDPNTHIPGYHINDSTAVRRKVLSAHVRRVARKKQESRHSAAKRIKLRLNVLRIYRRRRQVAQCRSITRDMRFLDRTFGGKNPPRTQDICES